MSSETNKPASPTAAPAPKPAGKPAAKAAAVSKPVRPVVAPKPARTVAKAAPAPAKSDVPAPAAAPVAPPPAPAAMTKIPAPVETSAPVPVVAKVAAPAASAKPVGARPAPAKPVSVKPAPVVTAPAPAPVVAKPAEPARPAAPTAAPPKAAVSPAPAVPTLEAAAASVGQVLPKAINDLTSSGLSQAREGYATLRENAEALTAGIETGSHAAARGLQDFSKTFLEALQANTDATLGFLRAMTGVRSVSEAIEMQSRHARSQFETVTSQAKALAGIAQRTAAESSEPVRKALDRSLRRGA